MDVLNMLVPVLQLEFKLRCDPSLHVQPLSMATMQADRSPPPQEKLWGNYFTALTIWQIVQLLLVGETPRLIALLRKELHSVGAFPLY